MATYRSLGIIQGVQGRNYIEKRGSFAALLVRALDYHQPGKLAILGGLPPGVSANSPFANEVRKLTGANLTSASNDFRPDDPITRYEAAALLVRAHEYIKGTSVAYSSTGSFADVPATSGDLITIAEKAKTLQIFNGTQETDGNTYFYSGRWANREVAIEVINRMITSLNSTSTVLSDTDCLLDWAEVHYSHLFSPAKPPTQNTEGFSYRSYPGTATYLGVFQSSVYVKGGTFGPSIVNLGLLSDFLPGARASSCK